MNKSSLSLQELIALYPDQIQYIKMEEKMPTAAKAAEVLGLNESDIAKTCILKTDTKEFIAIVLQGIDRINQKQLNKLLNCKKCRFATPEEVLTVTGYIAGGTPPIGLGLNVKKVFLDQKVFTHDFVIAGGGEQESLIKIKPSLIQELSRAEVVDVAEKTTS